MRQPQLKAIVFFIGVLLVGYAIAIPVATGILRLPLGAVTFLNMTAFAILFAVVMTIWLDKPLELELFKWPEKKPTETKPKAAEAPTPPAKPVQTAAPPAPPEEAQPEPPKEPEPVKSPMTALFPHEEPSEHWDADYANPKQVYEGAELPIWILAGWAIFILWAVIYLVSGLPGTF